MLKKTQQRQINKCAFKIKIDYSAIHFVEFFALMNVKHTFEIINFSGNDAGFARNIWRTRNNYYLLVYMTRGSHEIT